MWVEWQWGPINKHQWKPPKASWAGRHLRPERPEQRQPMKTGSYANLAQQVPVYRIYLWLLTRWTERTVRLHRVFDLPMVSRWSGDQRAGAERQDHQTASGSIP